MKIDTQLNQIESTSKRAMKYVRYFGKTAMTDRFFLCMIFLIVIAVIVLIILAAVKKKKLGGQ